MMLMVVVARLLLIEMWLRHLWLWLQRFMHPVASVNPFWVSTSETATSRGIMDRLLRWEWNDTNLLLRTLMRMVGMEKLLLRARNGTWASEVHSVAAWCLRHLGDWRYIKGLLAVFADDLERFQWFLLNFNLRLLFIGIIAISVIDS